MAHTGLAAAEEGPQRRETRLRHTAAAPAGNSLWLLLRVGDRESMQIAAEPHA